MPHEIYYRDQIIKNLAQRGRELTDKASLALVNRDYNPEDIMALLVDTLALQRDTLEAVERFAVETPRYPGRL